MHGEVWLGTLQRGLEERARSVAIKKFFSSAALAPAGISNATISTTDRLMQSPLAKPLENMTVNNF